jgi:hypothetical protein
MRKQYVKSLIFTLLFGIATIATALHELSPHHHADNCPVCVVDEHSLSADIVSAAEEEATLLFNDHYPFTTRHKQVKLLTTLNARAPPSIFYN